MSHPVEIIPVLDLSGGSAVHARGGARSDYRPVQSVLLPGAAGDALGLARAWRAGGARRCYVADLDAIAGKPAQVELLALLRGPAGFDGPLLVDAGIVSVSQARPIANLGAQVVVGLETLPSFATLSAIIDEYPVTFSADLRNGVPLVPPSLKQDPRAGSAVRVARAAAEAGAVGLMVLDLARVGGKGGPDFELLASIRNAAPDVSLLYGGGVREADDLEGLASVGCDGVLIATALHDGSIALS